MPKRTPRRVRDYGGRTGLPRIGPAKKRSKKKARKKTSKKRLPPRRADGRFKKRR